jgi:paraquat-inducible protein B
LDIKSVESNLNALLIKLDTTVAALHMEEINRGVTNLLTSINGLVTTPDITNMLAGIRPTLDQYRELGARLTSRVEPLADNVTNSLAEANRTLTELRGAAENLRSMLAPTSPLRHDLDLALEQIADAAHSVSTLADFLKQHPNALITGREVLPKKP